MSIKSLPLNVPDQLEYNWCWAATTVAVSHFYDPQSHLTQCEVVNRRLGRNDCCVGNNDALPAACNVQAGLTLPLYEAGHHRVTYANKLSFDEIVAEIENDRPVCVRVVWEQGFGGGHFAVIAGYIEDANFKIADVMIDDSIHGKSVHTFAAFREFYITKVQTAEGDEVQEGVWTHSYYTCPHAASESETGDQDR